MSNNQQDKNMSDFKKGDLVKEYLDQFPETPSLTLARMIYEENKEIFTNVETVRTQIRSFRGAMGISKRSLIKKHDRKYIREFDKKLFNPFKLPESDEKEFIPYQLPKHHNKILLLSDIHIPYHSISAITAAFNYGLEHNINTVFLNGDIIDFHALSMFVKDPRKRHFQEELKLMHEFLDSIQLTFPNAKFYYKQGNHSERLETYLKVKAPELYGHNNFELDTLLEFGRRNIEYINDKRTVKAGKLNILHGHELKSGIIQPVNPARGIFLRTNSSTITGHFHKTSQHTESDLEKRLISCWSTGCLCELAADYMPNGRANHGAAIINVEDNGNFNVDNFIIYEGKIYNSIK